MFLSKALAVLVIYEAVISLSYATGKCGTRVADIIFLVDESGSVSTSNFALELDFVGKVIDKFDVADSAAHIGVITFTTNPKTLFELGALHDKAAMKSQLNAYKTKQRKYTTGTDLAIKAAQAMFKTAGRDGVAKLVIVLTDGASDSTSRTKAAAIAARNANIAFYSIGVGRARASELENIAGSKDAVSHVTDFSKLTDIQNSIQVQTCKVIQTQATKQRPAGYALQQLQMSVDMEKESIKITQEALASQKGAATPDMAAVAKHIKDGMEKKYPGGKWNAVVGTRYGLYVNYMKNHYIFFRLEQEYFLIFRSPC